MVCERLYQISEDDPQQITSCRSGEDFEERVFVAAKEIIDLNSEYHMMSFVNYRWRIERLSLIRISLIQNIKN